MILTVKKISICLLFVIGISGMVFGFIAIFKKNDALIPLTVFLGILTFLLAIYINKIK